MCGICGIIEYTSNSALKEDTIRRMCSQMQHRGPDDEGTYLYQREISVGLGHRRLSIIDLSTAGHQPIFNEDKTVFVVFNGEIYNYKMLRKELKGKGHVFRSHTDTEVLVHLYEEYGAECVKYLRGMFAFALWDEKKKELLLARDRLGKKPILYYHNNAKFCFASEFTALLASGLIENQICHTSIDEYLTYGYIPAPFTIYKNVFKLPPAHMLILKDNEVTIGPYWRLDYTNKIDISEHNAAEEILRLLKESVRLRLYSDVALGAFLSGGIDSSTVVAVMSQLSSKKVKTFSIGFEDDDYNELLFARNIAERFGTEHHEFIVKPNALEILPLLIERHGEPYADSSCIPTYYVASQARRYVTVALNGDGGDESFAGYDRYRAMIAAELFQRIPYPAKVITQKLSRFLPDSINTRNKLKRVRRFINGASLSYNERYVKWVGIFDDEFKRTIYSDKFKHMTSGSNPLTFIKPFFSDFIVRHIIDDLLNVDVHTYLPNDLLVKVDIASMANSLEVRSPFLDHKLMEFVARLPAKYKLKGSIKKYILKKAIKGLVPNENIHRKKMGFTVPVGRWFRREMKEFLKEILLSESSLGRGYFRTEVIKSMVKDHISARRDYSFQLWSLLMLELWHQRFMD